MHIMTDEALLTRVSGILHEDTQHTYAHALDLTVKDVYRLVTAGSLDFGGSEYEAAGRDRIIPQKRAADDDYGWWNLTNGMYLVEYNESLELEAGQFALVQPHKRLLHAGASHAAMLTQGTPDSDDALAMLINVSTSGLHLKENARISTVFVLGATDA